MRTYSLLIAATLVQPAFSQQSVNECEQLVEQTRKLISLRELYTEKHPDVMQLQEQIDNLTRVILARAPDQTVREICPQLVELDEVREEDRFQDPDGRRQRPFP